MHLTNTICSMVCMQAHCLGAEKVDIHQRQVGRLIERELRVAIHDGVRLFRVGMNMGADIWAARQVLHLRDRRFSHIQLHCYLPCETQAVHWPEQWRESYFDALARADEVLTLQSRYTRGCQVRRNREMLKGSGRLLAVHDNIADGGIDRAIRYAEARGIEATVIQPFEGPHVPLHLSRHSVRKLQISSAYSEMFSSGRSAIKRAW